MSPFLLAALLSVSPPLADDLPPGSELALRVAVGQVGPGVKAALEELGPLAAAWPPLESVLSAYASLTEGPWSEPLRRCGVDASTRGAVLTVVADLEADGGYVVAAVLRGVSPKAPAAVAGELEERSIDGQRALILTGRDVAFAPGSGELVIGTERGVQRLVRLLRATRSRARSASLADDPLAALARGLRRETPVALAATLTPALRKLVAARSAPLGLLLAPVGAFTATLDSRGIDVALRVGDAKKREAVAGGMRALFAGLNAAGQGLLALGELAVSAPQLAPETPLVPKALDPALFGPAMTRWLADFRVTPAVHVRPQGVEVHADVTGWRGLAAATVMLGASWPTGSGSGSAVARGAAQPGRSPAITAGAGAVGARGRVASGRSKDASNTTAGIEAAEAVAAQGADGDLRDQAEALLFELRDAELAYKREHGRFLACGPVPRKLPREPGEWTPDGCFEELGFAPDADETLVQLEAQVDRGRLVLLARADPAGNGIPLVWYLDETAETVRALGAADDER